MNISINTPLDQDLILKLIHNIISFVDENDLQGLNSIIIKEKAALLKLFPLIKIKTDAWYRKDGYPNTPAIVICYEKLLKKKYSKAKYIFALPLLILLIIIFPFYLFICMESKNYKIWYLSAEFKIPRSIKQKTFSTLERKIVSYLLFYIGVHKYYNMYNKNGDYLNLNINEKASLYRKLIIDKYIPLYKKH